LKLALAGNKLTFSCPAVSLLTGQKGWTESLNAELGGRRQKNLNVERKPHIRWYCS